MDTMMEAACAFPRLAWSERLTLRLPLREPVVLYGISDVLTHSAIALNADGFRRVFGDHVTNDVNIAGKKSPISTWLNMAPQGSHSLAARVRSPNPLRMELAKLVPVERWLSAAFGSDPAKMTLVLSAGRMGEGVARHAHVASYHVQAYGRRTFQVAAPAYAQDELDDESLLRAPCDVLQVRHGEMPRVAGACTLTPGDLFLLPDHWWHSVCHASNFSWGASVLDYSTYAHTPTATPPTGDAKGKAWKQEDEL